MRSARWRRVVRFLALALVAWLGGDLISHGTCAHDLISFASPTSQVGDTGRPHSPSPDREDINRCSCHWQYVASAAPVAVTLDFVAPVVCPPTSSVPPVVPRHFERPPQGILA